MNISVADTNLQEAVLNAIESKSDKHAEGFVAEHFDNINLKTFEYLNNEDYGAEANSLIREGLKERLHDLAESKNEADRFEAAENPYTPAEILDKLSNDENERVREAAIANFKDENIEKKMDSVEVNNFTVETTESLQATQQQEQVEQNVEAQVEQQNKEHVSIL